MKTLRLILFLAAAFLAAATPGTITVTGQVTAVAGVITAIGKPNAIPGKVDATCSTGGQVFLTATITPQVGAVAGVMVSCNVGADNVTGLFTKTGNAITWDVVANGTHQVGSF